MFDRYQLPGATRPNLMGGGPTERSINLVRRRDVHPNIRPFNSVVGGLHSEKFDFSYNHKTCQIHFHLYR